MEVLGYVIVGFVMFIMVLCCAAVFVKGGKK